MAIQQTEKETNTMQLVDISIPDIFMKTMPRQEKIEQKKSYIQQFGKLDNPIIVHPETKELVDGWAGYLAFKKLGIKRIEIELGTKKRPRKPKPTKQEIEFAVWHAEDGRCENCKRAMDKRLTRTCRVNSSERYVADNLHLLCVDCWKGRPDPLHNIAIADRVLDQVSHHFEMEKDETQELLQELLTANGVILNWENRKRDYWVPGIGTFVIILGFPASVVVAIKKMYKEPRVRIKPQERTRGLPKPNIVIKEKVKGKQLQGADKL
ncbi:hypothetical protein SAMN04487866_12236 [Thermoactinomyces sp. DSM 45891]|uniref:hypothetical protein n=1 Tax=Thermoactinomyces sp. DSM 45891 TaxID=1761907 RepID=UPI0009188B41|nr:hypothetical protein [Thermoactinomyces sp. DSM 45891]SFX75170.1 hypothetical protein SAMN04487866_12236 [Thermoactinomyces sp. DSM 45891]